MSPATAQRQIVICGLGGQGIVFLARVMGAAAMRDGDEVLTAENHGMSQRGGAVEAHLKLGPFHSSLVRTGSADTLLVLDPSRLEPALPLLAPHGLAFANAPAPVAGVHTFDAAAEARTLGHPRGQNLILLGYAIAVAPERFPSSAALLASLEEHSPRELRALNRAAVEHGIKSAGIV